jgi:hypothetical protein
MNSQYMKELLIVFDIGRGSIGLGRNFTHSFSMNVDSALGDERVRRYALDIPLQGIEGNGIADSGGPLLPERALEMDDVNNECGVHASDLVPHRRDDFEGIIQGRVPGVIEADNLGGLRLKE